MLAGPQMMMRYQDFSLHIIRICLKTPQTSHIVLNRTNSGLIVAVLRVPQATDILALIGSRFPTDIATLSSEHFTSTLLIILRQFSDGPAEQFPILRLNARHSYQLPFRDRDQSVSFQAIPAVSRRK
jgi:hypothetical protein